MWVMTEQFHNTHLNLGSIEVICGSMFSGKSEELIRRLRRAQIAKQRVQIFKPRLDNRFSDDHIVSHSDMKMKSQPVQRSGDSESSTRKRRLLGSTKASSSIWISCRL